MALLVGGLIFGMVIGCSSAGSLPGTYVNQSNMRDTLQLRSGGTYDMTIWGIGAHGRYDVTGETLTLRSADGSSNRVIIQGKTITFPDDSVMSLYGTERAKQ
jgi:hypothetical protein